MMRIAAVVCPSVSEVSKRVHVIRTVLLLVVLSQLAVGQTATGTPPFGSIGGGPFDSVNLGNLNVHFAIPVLHKAGRGIPFTYDLSYDGSIWFATPVNNVNTWQP